ncbi:hypothetical protein [Streptomyces sp. FIT100]|uniref:hypothetical protein n=1 Tax=Streptomyces sp. FIT100 TaxID=2837956 RepID=UPI0021C92550|nr:hypothetical protein [Streptomyces sp. FIT100]UUN26792.1 hypothetical protein KK483_10515 [Streptomyces sp. FIT100]
MARHRRPARPTRLTGEAARRGLALTLAGASALTATVLAVAGVPAAPPAPDRIPTGGTSDVAQLSRE